jgi:hypothetical protein
MLAKLVPTFADRRWRVVSATDLHGRILGFLDRSRYYVFFLLLHHHHHIIIIIIIIIIVTYLVYTPIIRRVLVRMTGFISSWLHTHT